MNKCSLFFAVLTLLLPNFSQAKFVIQYGDEKGIHLQPGSKHDRPAVINTMDLADLDLVIDGRYTPVSEHGNSLDTKVGGAGSQVPLTQGIRFLTPEGFTVYKDPKVDGEAVKISWKNNEPLVEVLERAGAEHQVMFEIDWDKKVIAIRPGQPTMLASLGSEELTLELANAIEIERASASNVGRSSIVEIEEAPLVAFDLYRGENLRSLGPRVAKVLSLSRAVMDFAGESLDPSMIRTPNSIRIEYRDRNDLLRQLEDTFKELEGNIKFSLAQDKSGTQGLVVSTRGHAEWASLQIFDVEKGTLRKSALSLASLFGYRSTPELWLLDHDWPIPYEYPIVVTDAAQAYQRLFERYPAQAQLASGSREVIFVPRMQPKLNNGDPVNTRASLENRK